MMGFGYRLYLSYNVNVGVDNFVYRLFEKCDGVLALSTERRMLFLHRRAGGAGWISADQKNRRIAGCFPRRQAGTSVYDEDCRDIA